jgi:hypothetical protein
MNYEIWLFDTHVLDKNTNLTKTLPNQLWKKTS